MIRVSTLKKASSRQQSESKKGATLLWLYAGISTLGIGIARSKLSEMSQELVDKVCIFLSAGLSIILLLGIVFVKPQETLCVLMSGYVVYGVVRWIVIVAKMRLSTKSNQRSIDK